MFDFEVDSISHWANCRFINQTEGLSGRIKRFVSGKLDTKMRRQPAALASKCPSALGTPEGTKGALKRRRQKLVVHLGKARCVDI